MIVSDLEQLKVLSKSEAIAGGENLWLSLDDDLVNDELLVMLGIDDHPVLNRRLPSGKSLAYRLSGKTSGLLTARRQRNGDQLTQSVSLMGTTETGAHFSFLSTRLMKGIG